MSPDPSNPSNHPLAWDAATADATYTTDIPDNAGMAIFNNNTGGGSYSLANRLDAVGTQPAKQTSSTSK